VKRTIAAAVVVSAVSIAVVYVVRMRDASAIPDLAGDWKSWRSTFRIARESDAYRIVVDNPNGFLGGTYIGTPHGSAVAVTGPLSALCREIRYVKDGDKLQFCGEEFERVHAGGPRA
jgi:hypothetical protein